MSPAKQLQEITNASLNNCARALKKCNGDLLLAEGYLKFDGCAVNVPDYDVWLMRQARAYKQDKLNRALEPNKLAVSR